MNSTHLLLVCLLIGVEMAGSSLADEPPTTTRPQQSSTQSTATLATRPATRPRKPVLFKTRGSPPGRSGGGPRGNVPGDAFLFCVLTPDEIALTAAGQPTLMWYLSKPTDLKLVFTLNNESTKETVVRIVWPKPPAAGIHAVDLSDSKIMAMNQRGGGTGSGGALELSPDAVYRWSVMLTADPGKPSTSKDILAGGMVRRVAPPPDIQLNPSDPMSTAAAFAEQGIWYDALGALWRASQAQQADPLVREAMANLLEQAGLKDVAEAERSRLVQPQPQPQ